MFKRLIGTLLVVMMFVVFTHGQACAVTTGTTDGTYDFGGLGADDSVGAGSGFAQLGDKFKVGNSLFWQASSYNSGPMTAIYLNSPATTAQTAVIRAEGGSTCRTFTFMDLGVSGFTPASFSSLVITLKDINGTQMGAPITLGASGEIPTISVINISDLYSHAPWSVDGVAAVEITYLLSEAGSPGMAWDLNLENITIANVVGAPPLPPTVSTSAATFVTGSGATLNGIINANNFLTAVSFEYGIDTSYGSNALSVPPTVTGNLSTPVSATLSGLSPNTTYHYRVKGDSIGGLSYGDDLTFTTVQAATGCNIPGNVLTNCGFETGDFSGWLVQDLSGPYFPLLVGGAGLSDGLTGLSSVPTEGSFATLTGFDGNGPGTIRVAQDVTSLPANAQLTFDYRAAWDLVTYAGPNALGRTFGVTIEPAGGGSAIFQQNILEVNPGTISQDSGAMTANVNLSAFAGQNIRVSFDWWVPEASTGPAFAQLDNVRLVSVPTPPTVTTFDASSITGSGATLNGRVSANSSDTTVTFEFGIDTSYGSSVTASPGTVNDNLNTPVSAAINGLSRNTIYHYRVKGVSSGGTSYGDDLTFTTAACDLLADGGFEGGTPSASWAETSTNFGTPLWSDANSHTGSWYSWFGGAGGLAEAGSLSQTVLIPTDSLPRLTFYLSNPASSGNGIDYLKVFIDGSEVFDMLAGNPVYTGGYSLVDLDLAPYADGMCHSLSLQSTIYASSGNTNIMVDDVAIPHCSSMVRINATPSVSLQKAMDDAGDLGVISATAHVVTGELLFAQSGRVTFKGGYDCAFLLNPGYTTIDGKLTVSGTGTLVAERVVIR